MRPQRLLHIGRGLQKPYGPYRLSSMTLVHEALQRRKELISLKRNIKTPLKKPNHLQNKKGKRLASIISSDLKTNRLSQNSLRNNTMKTNFMYFPKKVIMC